MHIAPWAADWDVAYEWYGQVDQGRCSDSPRFTPIETRMSENNRYTTEDESKETQSVDPVCDADKESMPRRFQNLELLDGKPRKLRRLRHEICSNLSQQIEMVNLFIPLKMSPVRPRLATQTRGGQKSNIQTGAVDLCRSIGLIKIDHLRRKVASGSRSVLGNGMAANRRLAKRPKFGTGYLIEGFLGRARTRSHVHSEHTG